MDEDFKELYEAAVEVKRYFAIRNSSDPGYFRVMRKLKLAIGKLCKHENLQAAVWPREGQLYCPECGRFFRTKL